MINKENCPHMKQSRDAQPKQDQCEECDSRFNLRICMTCGHVGCCESQQAHNTQHFRATGHPIIQAHSQSARSFIWCYECKDYVS